MANKKCYLRDGELGLCGTECSDFPRDAVTVILKCDYADGTDCTRDDVPCSFRMNEDGSEIKLGEEEDIMGRMTNAIIYGVLTDQEFELDVFDEPAMFEAMREHFQNQIEDLEEKKNDLSWDEFYNFETDHVYVPYFQEQEDELSKKLLIGFWVAAGASWKRCCPDMPNGLDLNTLADIEPYKSRIEEVKQRWQRFDEFARALGVELSKPGLLITTTEVA
jgi:hypothetical protein